MWTCRKCQKMNEAHFDLCGGCGSNVHGDVDKFCGFLHWLRNRVLITLFLLPGIYLASYFLLSSHSSAATVLWSGRTPRQYTYHDRVFPFDPWVFQPLANLEYFIRGSDTEVVIKGGHRSRPATYSFGSIEQSDAQRTML